MDRINVNSLDPTNPLAVLSPGSRRGWQNQDLSLGLGGTIPNAEFLNPAQEELLALIEGVGLTANAALTAQVLQGLKRLFGGNYEYLTATTTLTADNLGIVVVNAATGAVTLTLPASASIAGTVAGTAVVNSPRLRVIRNDRSVYGVTIQAAGTDHIDIGAASVTSLEVPGPGVWDLVADGTATWLASSLGPQPHGSAFSHTPGVWNWTCPAGVYFVEVEAWDAGAGGGGGSNGEGGGGGGSGAYARAVVPVVPGTTYANVVGIGGGGGAGGTISTDGTAGSAPGSLTAVLFNGGSISFTAAQGGIAGGAGGLAGGGGVTVTGVPAGAPIAIAGNGAVSGTASGPTAGGSGPGGWGFGSGGAGGTASTGAGSNGANGAIWLRW